MKKAEQQAGVMVIRLAALLVKHTSGIGPRMLHMVVQVVHCKTLEGTIHICRPQIEVRLKDELC